MSSTNGNGENPFLGNIVELAPAEAEAERIERLALDDFLIANGAGSDLQRRMREGQEVHTSRGAYILDRVTGKPITETEIIRAQSRLTEAHDAYVRAANAATAARGQLNTAKKAAENWETTRTYLADQARQEAALTPAERAIRERRDLAQREVQ